MFDNLDYKVNFKDLNTTTSCSNYRNIFPIALPLHKTQYRAFQHYYISVKLRVHLFVYKIMSHSHVMIWSEIYIGGL